jgi:hypothetical protein
MAALQSLIRSWGVSRKTLFIFWGVSMSSPWKKHGRLGPKINSGQETRNENACFQPDGIVSTQAREQHKKNQSIKFIKSIYEF